MSKYCLSQEWVFCFLQCALNHDFFLLSFCILSSASRLTAYPEHKFRALNPFLTILKKGMLQIITIHLPALVRWVVTQIRLSRGICGTPYTFHLNYLLHQSLISIRSLNSLLCISTFRQRDLLNYTTTSVAPRKDARKTGNECKSQGPKRSCNQAPS